MFKMKFKYLGTAAAEGIPAVFCECDNCLLAKKHGGKNIRTRSQAVVDDQLLIDFPADTYYHTLKYGINLSAFQHCLITHTHSDHFYPLELEMRSPAYSTLKDERPPLTIYGTRPVGELMSNLKTHSSRIAFHEIAPFDTFDLAGYQVTPLKAEHDQFSGAVLYIIKKGEKTIFYANDTGYFGDQTWAYLERERPYLNLVSLDCTEAFGDMDYNVHMNVEKCIRVRDKLIAIGCADEKTAFYLNHFSHNGKDVTYQVFCPLAKEKGFLVSYDGLEIEV
jgi:phosphoribosyl 1,2-cyclic phosphate phosphodiesterase